MSDQVSSSVIRTRALAAAASAARSPSPSVDRGQQIDPGKALECRRHRQQFRLGERIGRPAAKRKPPDPGRLRRMRDHDDAVGHHGVIARIRAVPFQHGEFGQMQIAALAVAEHPRELEYLRLAGGQQFLGGEFRRGPQIARRARAVAAGQVRCGAHADASRCPAKPAGCRSRPRQTLLVEPGPDRLVIAPRAIRNGLRSACRAGDHHGDSWSVSAISEPPHRPQNAGIDGQNQYVAARNRLDGPRTPMSGSVPRPEIQEKQL